MTDEIRLPIVVKPDLEALTEKLRPLLRTATAALEKGRPPETACFEVVATAIGALAKGSDVAAHERICVALGKAVRKGKSEDECLALLVARAVDFAIAFPQLIARLEAKRARSQQRS